MDEEWADWTTWAQDVPDIGYFDGSHGKVGRFPTAMRHGYRTTEDRRLLVRGAWALFLHDVPAPRSGQTERPLSGEQTVEYAEWTGLHALLQAYRAHGRRGDLLVLGDSRAVIAAMRGERRVRSPEMAERYVLAGRLALEVARSVRYAWIPRAENAVADRLASHAGAGVRSARQCPWWTLARHRAGLLSEAPGSTTAEGGGDDMTDGPAPGPDPALAPLTACGWCREVLRAGDVCPGRRLSDEEDVGRPMV